jgi:RNA polymerase sigma-70 factor (ECF subfamily)
MKQPQDDRRAEFQSWVEPLLEQAGGYAYSLVRNHSDAEDAVQESLWKAYRGLPGYDRTRSFKGWWFGILRNCCMDLLQQRRVRARAGSMEEQGEEATARRSPAAEALLDALATLTPAQREILELRYFGGCSYRDLAEALFIPEGTVMSRLHSARLALATAYRKD